MATIGDTLGPYPTLGLPEAREQARRAPRKPTPNDRKYDREAVDHLIRRLQKNKADSFTLPDGTTEAGYLVEYFEFEEILRIVMRFRKLYLDKKLPGPERTFWEAYCAQPVFRWYLQEEEKYVNARRTERGKRAFALKAVVGDDPDKQASLGKQIDKWNKLPLTRGE
jgi:hypothetical protein